jgi:hypothetical protein
MINFAAKKSREMLASYLTPIVEGYANKYFSNLPDLQLSLWGGDIVLQNIAIRVQGTPPSSSSLYSSMSFSFAPSSSLCGKLPHCCHPSHGCSPPSLHLQRWKRS